MLPSSDEQRPWAETTKGPPARIIITVKIHALRMCCKYEGEVVQV